MAGVALCDIHLRFAWQAWRLSTSTFALRGRRGTYGTVARLDGLVAGDAAAFCVAGVALVTSTFVLRGRRGTCRHPPSLAWQAWHLWHCVARLDGLVAGDAAALCVAGVALMALGWLWCHTPCLSPTVFHPPLCHTIFDTPSFTKLCHTPSLTLNFVTHHLSHTTLSPTHTIFDPQLSHTPSFTHRFVTPSFTHHFVTHHLSHNFVTTIFDTRLCHTPSLTYPLSHTIVVQHHF